jgi:hypothetical protein
MTIDEYESALDESLIELSESKAQVERQHVAMNLLSNRGIENFAVFRTSNGCNHSFGIGVAVGVPLAKEQLSDLRSSLSGVRSRDVVVVVWRSAWPELNLRQISVFSPDSLRVQAVALRSETEHSHASDPFAIGVRELSDLIERVVPLLDGAEQRYRATFIYKGKRRNNRCPR